MPPSAPEQSAFRLPDSVRAGIEIALNRTLACDPATLQRLAGLSGKVIAIELQGPGMTWYLLPGAGGLSVLDEYAAVPDVTLCGTPLALAHLGLDARGADRLFGGEVVLRGDTDLGRRFGELLQAVAIDWEELASRVMGDVLAHQLGNAVRASIRWGTSTVDTLGRDLAEYLQEERQWLPAHAELAAFNAAVDRLRSDSDRLEARVKRLQLTLQHIAEIDQP